MAGLQTGRSDGRGVRARKLLVIAQVAVASILLVSAALLARGRGRHGRRSWLRFGTPCCRRSSSRQTAGGAGARVHERMLEDIRSIPGVEARARAGSCRSPASAAADSGWECVPRPGGPRAALTSSIRGASRRWGSRRCAGVCSNPPIQEDGPSVVNHVLAGSVNRRQRGWTDDRGLARLEWDRRRGPRRAPARPPGRDARRFLPIDRQFGAPDRGRAHLGRPAGAHRPSCGGASRQSIATSRLPGRPRSPRISTRRCPRRLTVARERLWRHGARWPSSGYAESWRMPSCGGRADRRPCGGATPVPDPAPADRESGRVVAPASPPASPALATARLLASMLYGVAPRISHVPPHCRPPSRARDHGELPAGAPRAASIRSRLRLSSVSLREFPQDEALQVVRLAGCGTG